MNKKKSACAAIVVAAPEGKDLSAVIVSGTRFLMTDIRETYGGDLASDSLGDPPGPGCWMWEGELIVRKDYFDGDYDVDYHGEYRRLTDDETRKLAEGAPFFEWKDEDEETP